MGKALESMLSKNPKTMRFYQFLKRNVMLEKMWQIFPTATQCQGARLGNLDVSQDFKVLEEVMKEGMDFHVCWQT